MNYKYQYNFMHEKLYTMISYYINNHDIRSTKLYLQKYTYFFVLQYLFDCLLSDMFQNLNLVAHNHEDMYTGQRSYKINMSTFR